jgi:hypothetical protein
MTLFHETSNLSGILIIQNGCRMPLWILIYDLIISRIQSLAMQRCSTHSGCCLLYRCYMSNTQNMLNIGVLKRCTPTGKCQGSRWVYRVQCVLLTDKRTDHLQDIAMDRSFPYHHSLTIYMYRPKYDNTPIFYMHIYITRVKKRNKTTVNTRNMVVFQLAKFFQECVKFF